MAAFPAYLERQLDYFAPAARAIAETAEGEKGTLAVAVCGSRGMAEERVTRHARIPGAGITAQSDLDLLVIATDAAAQASLQQKIAALPCLRVIPDVGRATRRPAQPPRREDVMELALPPQPGRSHEVDVTVLTLPEFRARYEGVSNMFDDCARGEDIGETALARHHLLSGFADSRIAGGTAVHDPAGIFAAAKKDASALSPATAAVLFERHIKVVAQMAEHVGDDWKNIFERASDQSILLDAVVRAHYALNRRLCQPGYKNYPGDAAEMSPDISAGVTRLAAFSSMSGPEHLRLAARLARALGDHDRALRNEPALSTLEPGFLAPATAQTLLCLATPGPTLSFQTKVRRPAP